MSNLLNLCWCIRFYTVRLHKFMHKICSRIIFHLVMLIWLFVGTHSAALSFDRNMTQESHGFRCCSLLVVRCTLCSSESCSGLCSDVPAAVICSQLFLPCGTLLEFFSKLKTPEVPSRKCRLLGQFMWTWDLVWKEGFPVCCMLDSHQAAQDRLLQSFSTNLQTLFCGNADLVCPVCGSALGACPGLVCSHGRMDIRAERRRSEMAKVFFCLCR